MLYEFTCRGKNWNDKDEKYLINSDTTENALTKLRILHGEDVYRRCYMVYEEGKCLKEFYSYGMLRERTKRDYGRKYYYHIKKMERMQYLKNLRSRG